MDNLKVNTSYMVMIFLTSTVANFGSGFALAGYNQSGIVIEK
jgi:hypothetical protein